MNISLFLFFPIFQHFWNLFHNLLIFGKFHFFSFSIFFHYYSYASTGLTFESSIDKIKLVLYPQVRNSMTHLTLRTTSSLLYLSTMGPNPLRSCRWNFCTSTVWRINLLHFPCVRIWKILKILGNQNAFHT